MSWTAETLYVDAGQLAVAFARLPVGQSLIYARGPVLDQGNAAVRMVADWRAAGTANCHTLGRDADGQLRHGVVKRAAPSAGNRQAGGGASSAGSAAGSPKAGLDLRVRLEAAGFAGATLRDAEAVLRLIMARARAGRLCPSHAEVAEELQLRDRQRAAYLLRQLNKAGLIEIWSRNGAARVVSITGTRLHTAQPDAPAAIISAGRS